MTVTRELRHASLTEITDLLQLQEDVKYDVLVPGPQLQYRSGDLRVRGGHATVTEDGVGTADAVLTPTPIFEQGLSAKLDIPRKYLAKMRGELEHGSDLLDRNVSYWLAQEKDKRFFVRGFKASRAATGVARAFLSDRYLPLDNYDVLLSVLDGVKLAGLTDIQIDKCNLSERQMNVTIEAPQIKARADEFLENYRSPWNGRRGTELPFVHCGISVRNSETGNGTFSLVPMVTVQICSNGMTMTKEAVTKVHLGAQMTEQSLVRWSRDTKHHYTQLVRNQAKDAVTSFLSQEYIDAKAMWLNEQAGGRIHEPHLALESVQKKFGYTDSEKNQILDFFLTSGDPSPVGLMQAVTATAQVAKSPDREVELIDSALPVLAHVQSLRS